MRRVALFCLSIVALLSAAASPTEAHPMSVSEMRARLSTGRLEAELWLDAAPEAQGDAKRRAALERAVITGLFVKSDGTPRRCAVSVRHLGDSTAAGRAATDQVELDCELPRDAQSITIKPLTRFGGLLLEVAGPSGPKAYHLLAGEESPPLERAGPASSPAAAPSDESSSGPSAGDTVARYLRLGFEHILPLGLDHVLFVLALFFLSPRPRPLLLQITAFTVAHSLTLGLAAAGVVSPPSALVEPLIAASIVFVGVENLRSRERPVGLARLGVVSMFGLVHGLGFAGVLEELGLPRGQEWLALAGFNVGVELGQIAVVLVALAVTWRSRVAGQHPAWIRVPASGAIALTGLFWVFERVLG